MTKHFISFFHATLALLIFCTTSLLSAAPEAIHYQGQVTVDGAPFDGTGYFKFAIVENGSRAWVTGRIKSIFDPDIVITVDDPGGGYTYPPAVEIRSTGSGSGYGAIAVAVLKGGRVVRINVVNQGSGYKNGNFTVWIEEPLRKSVQPLWNNTQGSQITRASSEPNESVALLVSQGAFSVPLGNSKLAGMAVLEANVFNRSPVFLRIWFSPDGSAFEQLTPDQPVLSVPYALRVADGAVTSESLKDGAVTSKSLNLSTLEVGSNSNTASGSTAVSLGGSGNIAAGSRSAVLGGYKNEANGNNAVAIGGKSNIASGKNAFASGYKADAIHDGSVVWADNTETSFASTDDNQFLIQAKGGVGINTNAPEAALHVKQTSTTGNIGMIIERPIDEQPSAKWSFYIAYTNNLGFKYNGDLVARITNSTGEFVALSDRRRKRDIQSLENTLDPFLKLNPTSYFMKSDQTDEKRSIGLIAQEVDEIFPSAVSEQEGIYGISYNQITVLNTAALIEMHEKFEDENETLQAKFEEAVKANEELEQRLTRIETLLKSEEFASR